MAQTLRARRHRRSIWLAKSHICSKLHRWDHLQTVLSGTKPFVQTPLSSPKISWFTAGTPCQARTSHQKSKTHATKRLFTIWMKTLLYFPSTCAFLLRCLPIKKSLLPTDTRLKCGLFLTCSIFPLTHHQT